MKYRTKLFLGLSLIVIISNGIFLFLSYQYGKETVYKEVGSSALSIAATTAVLINAEDAQKFNLSISEDTPLYREFEKKLRQVRDANRRSDVYVNFIYSLFPDSQNPQILRFAVDAEERGIDKTELGTAMKFRSASGKAINVNYKVPTILPEFVEDVWGKWLTAIYPIKNMDGKYIGNIRVDVNAHAVEERFHSLLFSGIVVFTLTFLFAIFLGWLLFRWFNKPLHKITTTLKNISQGNIEQHIEIHTKDEFAEVGQVINNMVEGLKQRNMLQTSLTRFVSHALAEKIMKTGELPQIFSERRKVTILICDIRNFTSISERIKPEEVVNFLNHFFEKMIEAIISQQGILDKYLGDGFLAIFGSPVDDPYQEDHAVHAALKMREALKSINVDWAKRLGAEIQIGVGINTGSAIVGNIGTDIHMEYTAIGDTVNLAARIENSTKELNTDILISEYTYIAADHSAFQFIELGEISVKGRVHKVKVYTI
ncbi:adenylate cyclase [Legionella norrlandica]|uniref:Adenylate cyclase n=1 Tax=Legionella norrlandica TaxID=1498499 RepID=A0A0A2T449_9GAMM|nr:adenylate/guanylate cyclase domain-containing protein [Legionella norrlandica]KGP62203.1 adenylate cyclase [Legionella norrlandica]